MVVEAATLEHGLLHIDLARPEPEKAGAVHPDPDRRLSFGKV
jgi:HSP20 family molecular chaperone IbpA